MFASANSGMEVALMDSTLVDALKCVQVVVVATRCLAVVAAAVVDVV